MRKRSTLQIAGLLLCAVVVGGLLFTGCKKNENTSSQTVAKPEATKPAAPAPPPPPKTPFGELVGVTRSDKTTIEAMCLGGNNFLSAKRGTAVFTIPSMSTICGVKENAAKGKVFVVLQFGAKAQHNFDEDSTKFASVTAGKYLARLDEHSWLSDSTGKQFKEGLLKTHKGPYVLSFEVPTETAGLVWHYGKKQYQLEPHPVEIAETVPPATPTPAK